MTTPSPATIPTPELGLVKAQDGDDTADYLVTNLANSLGTIDSLFNATSGHTHGGIHQGGPISSIPASAIADGTITSNMILDGAIQTTDLADSAVSTNKLANGAVTGAKVATGTTLASPVLTTPTTNGGTSTGETINTPTIATPTINGTISGSPTFNSGPHTTDWFRNDTSGQGIFNTPANQGIGFDASGAFAYPSNDRITTVAAAQTLSNKTLVDPKLSGTAGFGGNGQTLDTHMFVYGTGTFTLPAPTAGLMRYAKAWGGNLVINYRSAVIIPPGFRSSQ